MGWSPMSSGGCKTLRAWLQTCQGVRNPNSSQRFLERAAREGESPVGERVRTPVMFLSTTGAPGSLVGSWGDHAPRLNTLGDR